MEFRLADRENNIYILEYIFKLGMSAWEERLAKGGLDDFIPAPHWEAGTDKIKASGIKGRVEASLPRR
jgi:hypothetical protein